MKTCCRTRSGARNHLAVACISLFLSAWTAQSALGADDTGEAEAGRSADDPLFALLGEMLDDPGYDHLVMDISWDEVAKYVVATPDTADVWAALLEKHPTRFLFGTDSVAPLNWDRYAKTYGTTSPYGSA